MFFGCLRRFICLSTVLSVCVLLSIGAYGDNPEEIPESTLLEEIPPSGPSIKVRKTPTEQPIAVSPNPVEKTEAGTCVEGCAERQVSSFDEFKKVTQTCMNSLPEYCRGISVNLTKCSPTSLEDLPAQYRYESGYSDKAFACFSGVVVGLWDSASFIGNALYSPYGFIMDKQYRDEALNSLSFYAEQMMTDPVEALNGFFVSPILEEIDEFASCLNWSGRWEYFCEAGVQTLTGLKVFQKAAKVAKKPRSFKALDKHASELEAKVRRLERELMELDKPPIVTGHDLVRRSTTEALEKARVEAKKARAAAERKRPSAQPSSTTARGPDKADTASSTPAKKSGDNPEPVQPSSTTARGPDKADTASSSSSSSPARGQDKTDTASSTPAKKSGDNPEPVQPSSTPTLQKETWLRR